MSEFVLFQQKVYIFVQFKSFLCENYFNNLMKMATERI